MAEATLSCPRCEAALPSGAASCDHCGHAADLAVTPTALASLLPGLRRTNLGLVAVLGSVSLGLYYPVWFWRRREALNKLRSSTKLDGRVLLLLLALLALSLLLGWIALPLQGPDNQVANARALTLGKGVEIVSQLLCLLALIALWVQSFRVRRILLDHLNLHLGRGVSISWFYTFVFQILYLQGRINTILKVAPSDGAR